MRTATYNLGWIAAALAVLAAGCGDGSNGAGGAGDEHEEHAENGAPGMELVELDSTALAMAGIEIGVTDTVHSTALPATGTITYDQNRVSHIGPRTEGRILSLRTDLGARVRSGQVLAVLESPDVGATRADLHEAESMVEIARENYERERRLEEQGISSRRELLEAERELRQAEAALLRAGERLQALGAGHGDGSQFTVTAPFDGVVVEKHATQGEVVGPSDQLFTVADLGRLWIELDIYERDLRRVALGQPVRVTTTAYPDRSFDGEIVYIGDILDPGSRTVRARVEVENLAGALRPGMFARAAIRVSGESSVVVVPRGAVQTIEGRQVVWVEGELPSRFRAQPVETGQTLQGDSIEILSGLDPNERIVTEGAFTLKAQLSKGEFGGHGH